MELCYIEKIYLINMTEAYQKHGLEDTALYILNKEYEVGNTDLDGYIGQLYGI